MISMQIGVARILLGWASAVGMALSLVGVGAAWAQAPVPYPRIETGQHTARIVRIGVDRSERWLVTASDDKTARVWNLKTGKLERILRPPIGPGEEGRLYAVAITPDGTRVAVGGFTGARGSDAYPIYLFDRASGRLINRSAPFEDVANHLVFSADGARLAATFFAGAGLHILRATDLGELSHDDDCKADSYGADFDPAGRLVTTCYDGFVRLYDASGRRIAKRATEGGKEPFRARFSPDGQRIAVGFNDSTAVSVISGRDLSPLYAANTQSVTNGNLGRVAWSRDGSRLFAAGRFKRSDSMHPVVAWPDQGRGPPTLLDAASNTVMDLVPLSDGRLVFGAADPTWGVIAPNGQREQLVLPAVLDHRSNQPKFRLSADGRRVEFGFDLWDGRQWSRKRARFDLDRRSLEVDVSPEEGLHAPRTEGLPVSQWEDRGEPKFSGEPIALARYEFSRSLAIAQDASGFVLGTDWWLRSFDAKGQPRWQQPVPGAACAVNLSDDQRLVVAALGDGTIRWYDAATGAERLALFIHARDQRWVLFTPEGFYQASPGGDALIGYQLNQGPEHEGQFVDSAQLSGVFFRPDVITSRIAGDEAAVAQAVARIGDVRSVLAGGLPPRVELLSPANADSDGSYDLSVRITPDSGGVGVLRLFVNGAEIPAARDGDAPPGGGTVTQRLTLAPGPNEVRAVVTTRDRKVASQPAIAMVNVKAPNTRPALYVLAVGISHYNDESFNSGVRFAARDAEELVHSLQAGAGQVYRTINTTVLTSPEQTRLNSIETAIQALARARPEDVVVIFLAGHGKAYNGEYHFIPSDFLYDSDQAYASGKTLSHEKLEVLLKRLGAGKRLLILDTCGSGAAVDPSRANEDKDAISLLMRSSGRYILAAASPLGKALEAGEQGHGVYTYALMEGLAGAADQPPYGNGNGLIEVDELASYVAQRVPELTKRFGYQQVPMRSAAGQSFWIIRNPKAH